MPKRRALDNDIVIRPLEQPTDPGQHIKEYVRERRCLIVADGLDGWRAPLRDDPRLTSESRGERARGNEFGTLGDEPFATAAGGNNRAGRAPTGKGGRLPKGIEFARHPLGNRRDADELRMAVVDGGPGRRPFVLEHLGERESAIVAPVTEPVPPCAHGRPYQLRSELGKVRLVVRTLNNYFGHADARLTAFEAASQGRKDRRQIGSDVRHPDGRVAVRHHADLPAGAVW